MELQSINVRIPKEIVDWLDHMIERGIYKSRSEAIREYIRKYVEKRGIYE